MNHCPNCGEAVSDEMLFCIKCGRSLSKPAQEAQQAGGAAAGGSCPNCGNPLAPGAMFCMNCGRQTSQAAQQPQTGQSAPPPAVQPAAQPPAQPPIQPSFQSATQPATQQPPSYQAYQPGAPATAAAPGVPPTAASGAPGAVPGVPPTAAQTGAPPETGEKKKPFYKQLPVIISAAAALIIIIAAAGFFIGSGVLSFGKTAVDYGNLVQNYNFVAYVKDGELSIANVNSLDTFDVTSDLYSGMSVRDMSNARYIRAGHVQVTNNGSRLFYPDRFIEDGSYNLFTRTISGGKTPGDPTRIDTDIRGRYSVSENGKLVFYIKGEAQTLYANDMKDKVKIANDVGEFIVDKNGSRLYYTDSEYSLYFRNKNNTPEKVDNEVQLIGASPDLSSVYYIKDGTLYRKKQNENKEKITAGINNVIKLYDSGELYYTKETDSGGDTINQLYYYDGASETKLGAGQEFLYAMALSPERPALAYMVDVQDDKNAEYRFAVKGADSEINISKSFRIPVLNLAGTILYYVDDYNETRRTGDLWRADVADDGLKQATQLYEDVYSYSLTTKGAVLYYSELNRAETAAELYLDGKLIDTDVLIDSEVEITDSGNILYYTDYNSSRDRGTLKISEKGKPILIADDVSLFTPLEGKKTTYLVIEGTSSSGDLLRYDGSKDKKQIDSDVILALPVCVAGSGGQSGIKK